MAQILTITVDFDDETDCDFLRSRLVGAVEYEVAEFVAEARNDGDVDVSWGLGDQT